MKSIILAALLAVQEPAGFSVGETLNHMLSVCLQKADAIEIVNTDATKGLEAANALWDAKPECNTVPVVGLVVGGVVHSASVLRDGKGVTMRVVELKDGSAVAGYFLSSRPLLAKLEVTEPPKKSIPIDPKTNRPS